MWNEWVPIKKASKRYMCTREPFQIHCGMFNAINIWRVQNRIALPFDRIACHINKYQFVNTLSTIHVFTCVSYNLLMLICVLPGHYSTLPFLSASQLIPSCLTVSSRRSLSKKTVPMKKNSKIYEFEKQKKGVWILLCSFWQRIIPELNVHVYIW